MIDRPSVSRLWTRVQKTVHILKALDDEDYRRRMGRELGCWVLRSNGAGNRLKLSSFLDTRLLAQEFATVAHGLAAKMAERCHLVQSQKPPFSRLLMGSRARLAILHKSCCNTCLE